MYGSMCLQEVAKAVMLAFTLGDSTVMEEITLQVRACTFHAACRWKVTCRCRAHTSEAVEVVNIGLQTCIIYIKLFTCSHSARMCSAN